MALKYRPEQADYLSLSSAVRAYAYVKTACEHGVDVVAVNNSWGSVAAGGIMDDVIDDLYRGQGVL